MEKIKMAIIGAGLAWEKLHYPAYARLMDKFEITGVCDLSMEKAKNAAAMIGLGSERVYNDYHQMFGQIEADAADLMVPISDNFQVAKDALEAGKHLIAEKPYAATADAAKELIRIGKKKNQIVMVAENVRYDEENNIIKNLLKDKAIGNPVYFIDNHVTEFSRDMLGDSFSSTEWRQHPEFKGGIFMDSAIHHIALFRFLFGDVNRVYAHGRHSDMDFCPYSCINSLLTFEDGIAGHYAFYCIGKETQAPLVGLRIFGTHGEIFLEDKDCGFVNLSLKNGEHQAIPYSPGEGYYNELTNFYHSVKGTGNIISTPEKELGDIQVIQDILKSAESDSLVSASNNYTRRKRTAAR